MKRLFFILTCIAFLCLSCQPPNSIDFTIVSQEEINSFLVETNHMRIMYGPELTTGVYAVPSVRWIEDVYVPFTKDFLSQFNLTYREPSNNCVKYSSYGLTAGYLLFNKLGVKDSSLAIGVTDYLHSFYASHSVNVFVATDEYNQLVLVYFDPSIGAILPNEEVDGQWFFFRM